MLLLNRTIKKSIFIGENIEVMVTNVKQVNGEFIVELGIDAPDNVCIDRKEVRERRLALIAKVANGNPIP